MCGQSWFFPECAANHVFSKNVLLIMFFTQNVLILVKNMIGSTFWEKNIIDSTFWEKHDWQHILGKTMIGSTFWGKKNMTFPECAAIMFFSRMCC
jgi:hypothetical protein